MWQHEAYLLHLLVYQEAWLNERHVTTRGTILATTNKWTNVMARYSFVATIDVWEINSSRPFHFRSTTTAGRPPSVPCKVSAICFVHLKLHYFKMKKLKRKLLLSKAGLEMYAEPYQTSKNGAFCENSCFLGNAPLRCLTGFWMRLW